MNRTTKRLLILPLIIWMIVSLSCNLPFVVTNQRESVEEMLTVAPEVVRQVSHELSASTLNMLGNLEHDGVSMVIPKDTFNSNTNISIDYLAEPPAFTPTTFTPLGVTVALSVDGEQTRFNEPVMITFKFDTAQVNGSRDVFVGYYDDQFGWYYFIPDEVEIEQGVIRFTTYHFSKYTVVKPNDDLIIESYVNRRATEQFVRGNNQELTNEQVEKMVRTLMEEGMQIYDNRTIEIITRAVIKEVPLGKIGLAIYDADLEGGVSATLEETVKALGKAIQEGTVSEVAGKPGLIEALSGAAGWAWESEYQEALNVLGGGIVDEIPGVKEAKVIAETAAEVVNHWVDDLWKAPGLEKAYEVYATGQDKYGFRDVEQGNFEDVYNQLGGLADKVRSDYVNGYCKMRGIDPKSLSREEHARIGERGLDLLRQQWESRYSRREEIERIRVNEMALIEFFKEKGLLEMVPGRNPMYTGNEDIEMMLNRLQQMTQRVLRDTGRTGFVTHSYDYTDPDNQLWGQDIADLVWIWYANRPNSEEAYLEALIERDLVAAASEDAGCVSGSMITGDGFVFALVDHELWPDVVYKLTLRFPPSGGAVSGQAEYEWDYGVLGSGFLKMELVGEFSGGNGGLIIGRHSGNSQSKNSNAEGADVYEEFVNGNWQGYLFDNGTGNGIIKFDDSTNEYPWEITFSSAAFRSGLCQ